MYKRKVEIGNSSLVVAAPQFNFRSPGRLIMKNLFALVCFAAPDSAQSNNSHLPTWWAKLQTLLLQGASPGSGPGRSLQVGANVDVSNECGPRDVHYCESGPAKNPCRASWRSRSKIGMVICLPFQPRRWLSNRRIRNTSPLPQIVANALGQVAMILLGKFQAVGHGPQTNARRANQKGGTSCPSGGKMGRNSTPAE